MDINDNLSLSHVEVTVPTTFLCTFVVNVHLGFQLIFFSRVNELFNSIKIEIVNVSNNRAVPCMGLGSRLHLLSGDQQLFLIILHNYYYKLLLFH